MTKDGRRPACNGPLTDSMSSNNGNPGSVQASLVIGLVAGASAVTSARATNPLKLLTPRPRGASVWAYTSSFGGGLVAGDQTCLHLTVDDGDLALALFGSFLPAPPLSLFKPLPEVGEPGACEPLEGEIELNTGRAAVRFEPGETKTVKLVEIAGKRVIRGGNNLANGKVSTAGRSAAMRRVKYKGFATQAS